MSPKGTTRKPATESGEAKSPRTSPARTAATRKAPAKSFETAFAALGRKADEARTRLSEMTDEGAQSAGRTLQKASRATQSGMRKLNADWKKLPPKRKAQAIAGVLGVIAAAVAVPIVVRQRRKARAKKSPE